ncbi:MAG: hypothetical protein MJ080_05605, partial [Clostridia bacterium]|nr:hypothetical protein [Clostridia bacterium]
MVRFVSGLSPSNNTKFIYEDIIKNAENGKNTVLIIPEQYSFECEKSVLEITTDNPKITGEIEVLPFSRM